MRDTSCLERIENGIFPFGKHVGTAIEDAPESYILFFADKFGSTDDVVTNALAAVCQGIALEEGYIAAHDAARAERAELDAKSNHIGNVGERIEFTGEIVSAFHKPAVAFISDAYWIVKVRCGEDLVAYIGSKALGDRSETITFKATIKAHSEYKGIKETRISRPFIK